MKKILAAVALVVSLGSCGGDSALSQQDACKSQVNLLCDKFFSCYSTQELSLPAVQAIIGLNAADCKVKYSAECTADKVKCNLGQTYHADKAQACVDAYSGLSCADVKKDKLPEPAACAQVCST